MSVTCFVTVQLDISLFHPQIDLGRSEAKNNDVDTIKAQLRKNFGDKPWAPPLPEDKTLWGYRHDGTGELLCPIGMDFSDQRSENSRDFLFTCSNVIYIA
jgi:hypothetical protein